MTKLIITMVVGFVFAMSALWVLFYILDNKKE